MNQTAIEKFSTTGVTVLCVVLGVLAVASFFYVTAWLSSLGSGKPDRMTVRGVFKKDTWVAVHMAGSETFERVRIVGFTQSESMKGSIPYDLSGMAILADPDGRKFLVRAKAIRMIVVAPEAK